MNGRLSTSTRKSGVYMPPLVKDWEKDVVYLVQIPRAGAIPSVSPYCMKLETWLRMANVPYRNVSNEFSHVSHKGQIPFVELNGRQYADSNHIITDLTKTFNVQLDNHLSEKEWANMQAYHCLVENSILWVNFYYRAINNNYLATNDGIMAHFTGFKKFWFKNVIMGQRKRALKKKCDAFGIGRDTPYEVEMVGKKWLTALSIFLDDKKFLMGDLPTTVDATAFATLCQFYYLPVNADLKNLIEEKRNLIDYIRNMREEYWPDWGECTTTLSLQTKPKQKEVD
uniref:Failed axon connections protein n=1 Tax=Panagrolaimus sp. PS1159 TaxID=55785 RepID=A0AC35FYG6_9BILA